jgi:hypothetical protein
MLSPELAIGIRRVKGALSSPDRQTVLRLPTVLVAQSQTERRDITNGGFIAAMGLRSVFSSFWAWPGSYLGRQP